jgi:transposase
LRRWSLACVEAIVEATSQPRQVEEQGELSTPRAAPRDGSWRCRVPNHDREQDQRGHRYNDLLDASKPRINTALAASGTSLTTISGVGPICAAMIIGESGNVDRFKSKHHFASYNATAPVERSNSRFEAATV